MVKFRIEIAENLQTNTAGILLKYLKLPKEYEALGPF